MNTMTPAADDEQKKPNPGSVAAFAKKKTAIRTVRLGDLRVSPVAQRELNQAAVVRMHDAGFDPDRLGYIVVSERDGSYWIIDGQHRFELAKLHAGDEWADFKLEAQCYFGLSEEQEAAKFLELNDKLAVTAFDKFRIGVVASLPVQSDIDRVVRSLGLKVARERGAGAIGAVTSLEKVYKSTGPGGLAHTLAIVRDAFGGFGFESSIIAGVSAFRSRYEGRISEDEIVRKLSRTPSGFKGLMQRSTLIREATGKHLSDCTAAALTEIYNQGRRGTNSLGSWWRDGQVAA